jgi:hypothetical protein
MSLRMLANLRLADLRLTTAQQRSTGRNLPFDLYINTGFAGLAWHEKRRSLVLGVLWMRKHAKR